MLTLSKNSTSIYFNTTHRFSKHNCLISLEHMDTCSYFRRTTELRSYLADLKRAELQGVGRR
jgi:hypothetical protein